MYPTVKFLGGSKHGERIAVRPLKPYIQFPVPSPDCTLRITDAPEAIPAHCIFLTEDYHLHYIGSTPYYVTPSWTDIDLVRHFSQGIENMGTLDELINFFMRAGFEVSHNAPPEPRFQGQKRIALVWYGRKNKYGFFFEYDSYADEEHNVRRLAYEFTNFLEHLEEA